MRFLRVLILAVLFGALCTAGTRINPKSGIIERTSSAVQYTMLDDGQRTVGHRLGGNNWEWHTDGQVAKWARHDVLIGDLYAWAAADSFEDVVDELVAINSDIIVLGFDDFSLRPRNDPRKTQNAMYSALWSLKFNYPGMIVGGGDTAQYGSTADNLEVASTLLITNILNATYRQAYVDILYSYMMADSAQTNCIRRNFGIYIDILENLTGSLQSDLDNDGTATYLDDDEKSKIMHARIDFITRLRMKFGSRLIVGGQSWLAAVNDTLAEVLDFVMLEDVRANQTDLGTHPFWNFCSVTDSRNPDVIRSKLRSKYIDPFIILENDYWPYTNEAFSAAYDNVYNSWQSTNVGDKYMRDYNHPEDQGYDVYDLGDPVRDIQVTGGGLRIYRQYDNGSVLIHLRSAINSGTADPQDVIARYWIAEGDTTQTISVCDTTASAADSIWADTIKGERIVRSNAWPTYKWYLCTNDTTVDRAGHVYDEAGAQSILGPAGWPAVAIGSSRWRGRAVKWSNISGTTAAQGTHPTSTTTAYSMNYSTWPKVGSANGFQSLLWYGMEGIPKGTHIKKAMLYLRTSSTYHPDYPASSDTLFCHLIPFSADTAWVDATYGAGGRPLEADATWTELDDGVATDWRTFTVGTAGLTSRTDNTMTQYGTTRRGIKHYWEPTGGRDEADTLDAGTNDWYYFDVTRGVSAVVNGGTPNAGFFFTYKRAGGDAYAAFVHPSNTAIASLPFLRVWAATGDEDPPVIAQSSAEIDTTSDIDINIHLYTDELSYTEAEFKINSGGTWTSGTGGAWSSTRDVEHVVNLQTGLATGDIAIGDVLYYRVRVRDAEYNTSAWLSGDDHEDMRIVYDRHPLYPSALSAVARIDSTVVTWVGYWTAYLSVVTNKPCDIYSEFDHSYRDPYPPYEYHRILYGGSNGWITHLSTTATDSLWTENATTDWQCCGQDTVRVRFKLRSGSDESDWYTPADFPQLVAVAVRQDYEPPPEEYGDPFIAMTFEDASSTKWLEQVMGASTADDYLAVTTSNPKNGSKSLRGNLLNTVAADPITGLPGHSGWLLFRISGGDTTGGRSVMATRSSATGKLFVSFWMRYDTAEWRNSEGALVSTTGVGGHPGKQWFISDEDWGTNLGYSERMWTNTGFTFKPNSSTCSYPYPSPTWGTEHWGNFRNATMGNAAITFDPTYGAADGVWHKYEYFFDYTAGTLEVWIDGYKLYPIGDSAGVIPASGEIPIPKKGDGWPPCAGCTGSPDCESRDMIINYWYMQYLSTLTQISGSLDRGSGYACGVQYDDILIYDHLPFAKK